MIKSRAIVALSTLCFTVMMDYASAGGWVNGSQPLSQATAISTGSTVNVTPTFNNAQFTDKILVSGVNNNPITTPSTADPVSTITGNNYHDELDFQIRGRNGLNYVFSRTNNSGKSAATTDVGFGYGWVHSYSMNLLSNDFGACPNCTQAQAPANFDGVTSSITYTDERGGQANFLETPTTTGGITTYSVTNPLSVFNTLTLSTPSNGNQLVTLAFRNGTQYLFNVTGGDIGVTPKLTAKLTTIKNQWGDQLNINYDTSGRISTITDNLGISGRTGLTFNYGNGDNHITSISDWAGRIWKYAYVSGYLNIYTDPLNYNHDYYYTANKYYNNFQTGLGNYLLQYVIKPQLRNGLYVYTTFNYYQNGRVINYYDGMGDTEILDYDLFRSRTRVTDPRNNVREYDYDTNGFMTKMIEPDGGILYFTSQADSLRASKTDALGYKTQYSYCLNNSLTTCPNSAANNNTGGSDTGGNVTLEQDTLGYTIKTSYGPYDQVASVTDKNGNTVNTSFYTTTGQQANKCDLTGKPNTVTIAALTTSGTTTNNVALQTYCWNSNGTLSSLNEYLDTAKTHIRTTSYTYDPTGLNVTDVKVTATNTTAIIHTQYTNDNLGRVLTSTLNRTTSPTNSALVALTTSYTYDALDRAVQVKNPEGRINQTVYDGNGQVYQQITWYPSTTARNNCAAPAVPTGYTSSYVQCTEATYSYDAADRPISVTDVYGNTTSFVYDQSGNLISKTDPKLTTDANYHTTQYQYDPMNRVTAIIDANGRTSKAVYNERGDLTSVTNPNNETVTSVYDALGRLTKVTDNMGNITTIAFDKNSNKTCLVDANNHTTTTASGYQPLNSSSCTVSYIYDQLNRLTQVTDAQNHATAYTYNLFGQQLTVTDANSHITTLAYDDLGRLTTATDPMTNSVSLVSDEAGNLMQLTDRKGQISQHFYDVMNRRTLSNFEADSSSDTFTYNSFDDLTNLQNNSTGNTFSYSLTYDSKHRLLSKTDSRLGLSESWGYDPAGNISTKTDYQGNVTTYQYDDSNRLAAEANPAYLEVSYHYDPAGRLLDRILSNGAKTSYKYDAGGRLSSLVNTAAPNPNNTIVSAVINSTTYTRDAIGNILTAIEASSTSQVAGISTFTYDPEYRLLTAVYPTTANNETITYDPVGNRTKYIKGSTTLYYNVNAANRYTTTNTTSATGPTYEIYTYDKNGSLTNITGNRTLTLTLDAHNRASQIQVGALAPYSYQYDISNYRILKNLGASTSISNYYLENGKLESIYDNNGNVQAKYMRGSVIDEVVNGYQTNGTALTNYTYHHDALESVLGQSGNTGTVVAAQGYTSLGSTVNATGSSSNTLKFTGREQDIETGLYYYRARYYDPITGRFLSEDPIRSGINYYAYCGNNPVNCRDPSGLWGAGVTGGGTFEYGEVYGAAYQANSGGGVFWDGLFNQVNLGAFTASGGFAGGNHGLSNFGSATQQPDGSPPASWVVGVTGGLGAGLFLTNATKAEELLGPFDTWTLNLPLVSLQVAYDGNIGTISANWGKSLGISASRYPVTTTTAKTVKTFGTSSSSKTVSSQSNASPLSNVANSALIAGTNSAMDAVTSAINPPSVTQSVTTGTLTTELLGFGENAADGGFVLYPNMSNTNQIQSVYSKH